MLARKLLVCLAVFLMLGLMTPFGMEAAAAEAPRRFIIVWRDDLDADRETDLFERLQNVRADFRYSHALKGFAVVLPPAIVPFLSLNPRIKFISEDREVQAIGGIASGDSAPNGVLRIAAATSSTASDASSVSVAVIDTGIQLSPSSHPDLNAVSGKNCINTGATANDDNGHGTHVAGTIAAKNQGSGVVGVAPGTTLYAVKVLNAQGSGTWAQVICGIDWVTANAASLNIKVASMSLGGGGSNDNNCGNSNFDALHRAICSSVAAGVTYVVAAGNSNANFASSSPASYPEALTVTAMSDSDGAAGGAGGAPTCRAGEADDRYASFSNYAVSATEVNHAVAGPGVCINSTWINSGYNTISGTSMATPHVSGVVALCIGTVNGPGPCSGKSPAQIVQQIRSDAQANATSNGFAGDPFSPVGTRYYGYLAYAGGYGAPDTTAPQITSGPAASSITSTSATITWGTNESSSSQVTYWPTGTSNTSTASGANGVTNHSVQLTGLSQSTGYTYQVTSADAANNSVTSAEGTFTTAAPDTTAPVITSGPSASSITTTSATITWTTDESSSSQVTYRTSTSGPFTATGAGGVTNHSVQLTGLSSNTTYTYTVTSADAAGNSVTSTDATFTTAAGSNNNFANAFTVVVPGSVSSNNRGATRQPSEPRPCGSIGATVWYKFTAGKSGTLTASTMSGTNYDSVVAVYTGTALTNLQNRGCNDDFGGTLQSQVNVQVTAGTQYYVQVGGWNGATGDFTLQLTLP